MKLRFAGVMYRSLHELMAVRSRKPGELLWRMESEDSAGEVKVNLDLPPINLEGILRRDPRLSKKFYSKTTKYLHKKRRTESIVHVTFPLGSTEHIKQRTICRLWLVVGIEKTWRI